MTYKAVIFDFNGTLLWDTHLHNDAWDKFLEKHNISMSNEEKFTSLHGKPNTDILSAIFGQNLTKQEIVKFSREKEKIYQDICSRLNLSLAPGAEDFINFLKQKNIDFAIATSSDRGNVEFYLANLKLANWTNPEYIIFDDGTFKGKPHPDIFLKAIKKIGHRPEDVLVFEDSHMGIKAAENAKVGKIIIVNSNNDDYSDFDYQIIKDFEEVDQELFIN